MAQITLITGVPGHGKSLLAITKGLAFVAEGRTVYAAGFKDLDYAATGFIPLPTPFETFDRANLDDVQPVPNVRPDWMLLEDAVIIYDECYSVMPSRAAGAKVPVHVDALARHRHYNIDLVFVTQKHDQIDNFVRGLINEHIHVTRKFGFDGAVLKTWDAFQLNTDRKSDRSPLWRYQKQNYALYRSATAHSVKKRLPWFVWAPLPLLALICGLVWYVVHAFGAQGKAVPATTAAVAAAGGGSAPAQSEDQHDALRQRDYAQWIKPRVSGLPWTAPAFDHLRVATVPRVFCAAVEDGDCKCVTEQGTAYVLDKPVCRAMAKGGTYNPFVKPDEDQRVAEGHRPAGRDRDYRPDTSGASELGGAVSSWPSSAMRAGYQPPELTHAPGG